MVAALHPWLPLAQWVTLAAGLSAPGPVAAERDQPEPAKAAAKKGLLGR